MVPTKNLLIFLPFLTGWLPIECLGQPASGLPVLTDLDNNLGTAGYDVCEGDCGEFFALFLAIGT